MINLNISSLLMLCFLFSCVISKKGVASIWRRTAITHFSTTSHEDDLPSFASIPAATKVSVEKLKETTVFEGYRNILRRDFLLSNGKVASYDILTQKHLSVVVFAWNSTTKSTVLVREYHPGPETFMYGTVAGMYEFQKHSSPLQAAQFELEEEAQLTSDVWVPLLEATDSGMPFDKYSTNRFFPYLALDCTSVMNPRSMDDDELITVVKDVSYETLLTLIQKGQMNVVSTYAILLGVQKLKDMGYPIS
jgi:hypothetical protein